MKKIALQFIIFLMLIAGATNAQNLIAVQNNNTPSFYNSIDEAIDQATDGDTLYLPGGSFNITVSITKRLHIIGVGHNPDSSNATNPTYITGDVALISGGDGGSITGIKILGSVRLGTSSVSGCANNYTLCRCFITGGVISNNYIDIFYAPTSIVFIENIISGYVVFGGGQNNSFFNNILSRLSDIGSYNIVKNNIFLDPNISIHFAANGTLGIFNSVFENNIFLATQYVIGGNNGLFQNNVFNNNLFVQNITFPYNTTNIGFNNIVNQPLNSIFINQSGNTFDYSHDYHLQPTCPGINAGRDGTDIGIYGGVSPWKEGSIPINPHFQSIIIDPHTDTEGNLNVNIKVSAQDR